MKVLIIDDYFDFARSLKDCFNFRGHNAEYCMNSRTAIEWALNFKPEWIVLDVRMPNKSGLELFLELKEKSNFEFSAVFYSTYLEATEVINDFRNFEIPDKAQILKSGDLDSDVSEKLIPALEGGYLRGGKKG